MTADRRVFLNVFLFFLFLITMYIGLTLFTETLNSLNNIYVLTGFNTLVACGWIASAIKIVPEEWLDDLKSTGISARTLIIRRVLRRRWASWIGLGSIGLVLIVGAFWGGLRVKVGSEQQVAVHPLPATDPPTQPLFRRIKPGDPWPYGLCTPFWKAREVEVEVKGLPRRRFHLRHWWPTEVEVPDDLYESPVILLVMSDAVLSKIMENPGRLEVEVTGADKVVRPASIDGFDGNSVWIGCQGDVVVPGDVEAVWKQKNWIERHRDRRTKTTGTNPILRLAPNEKVVVTIKYGEKFDHVLPSKSFVVGGGGRPNFPKLEDF